MELPNLFQRPSFDARQTCIPNGHIFGTIMRLKNKGNTAHAESSPHVSTCRRMKTAKKKVMSKLLAIKAHYAEQRCKSLKEKKKLKFQKWGSNPKNLHANSDSEDINSTIFNDIPPAENITNYPKTLAGGHRLATVANSDSSECNDIKKEGSYKSQHRLRRVPLVYLQCDQDIVDIHGWRYLSTLGEGSYGKVYSVANDITGGTSALKRMLLDDHVGLTPVILREILALSRLDHSHVIPLEKIYLGNHRVYLEFQRANQGNLKNLIENQYPNGMPIQVVKQITRQLLEALDYCHSSGIVHRDIKPENILCQLVQPTGAPAQQSESSYHVFISDFGLCRLRKPLDIATVNSMSDADGELLYSPVLQDEIICINSPTSPEVLTLCYRSPELLLGDLYYSFLVDVWSLGCVIYEMITGKALFDQRIEFSLLVEIFAKFGTPSVEEWPQMASFPFTSSNLPNLEKQDDPLGLENYRGMGVDDQCMDFLTRMLSVNPNKRITAQEALQHAWPQ